MFHNAIVKTPDVSKGTPFFPSKEELFYSICKKNQNSDELCFPLFKKQESLAYDLAKFYDDYTKAQKV